MKAAFCNGEPFRYAVIDNFFDDADALAIHRAFPSFANDQKKSARLFSGRAFGPPPAKRAPAIREAFAALAARPFVDMLSDISGIAPLAMDETFEGAGVHVGLRGSELPIHCDHNTHPKAAWLYRRLNLLVYLNPNWQPSWRANLRLYDRAGLRTVAEIEPRFNRAVLMDVHDRAFHGYRMLDVPEGEARQSLALYYYSLEPSSEQSRDPHGTVFAKPRDIPPVERMMGRMRRSIIHRFPGLLPHASWAAEDADDC